MVKDRFPDLVLDAVMVRCVCDMQESATGRTTVARYLRREDEDSRSRRGFREPERLNPSPDVVMKNDLCFLGVQPMLGLTQLSDYLTL